MQPTKKEEKKMLNVAKEKKKKRDAQMVSNGVKAHVLLITKLSLPFVFLQFLKIDRIYDIYIFMLGSF